MSREIKFKFWLGHTKKMTYEHNLIEISHAAWDFTEDIIALQYTGLKDKNGKEIYEGDIVNRTRFFASNENHIGKVVFIDGCFIIEPEITIIHEYVYNAHNIEIIGNIYENANIIKAT